MELIPNGSETVHAFGHWPIESVSKPSCAWFNVSSLFGFREWNIVGMVHNRIYKVILFISDIVSDRIPGAVQNPREVFLPLILADWGRSMLAKYFVGWALAEFCGLAFTLLLTVFDKIPAVPQKVVLGKYYWLQTIFFLFYRFQRVVKLFYWWVIEILLLTIGVRKFYILA